MIDSIEYNTERDYLRIPEYGRHIQKMVNHCKETEDRDERNKIAKAIIGVMGNLNPHLRDVPDFQHKLWDQLFIMADFDLDVDSPYPQPSEELYLQRPEPLAYPQNHPKYRFYGNNIKRMIDVCISWEDGDLKQALKYNIANHMKKSFLSWNKDSVEDEVIFKHLYELSDGQINLARFEEDLTASSDLLRTKPKSRSNNNNYKSKNNRNNKGKNYGKKRH
ncbi:protein of unknown function [Pustulibacterium marinum]|uniref:DNA phosphorothioation-dependent restriction protein DptG n=1 Tax=Pustulibacterium marinum TaxID=1224947 RepID=A0A1I7HZT3_9FLAO|nr:DUF4290 domain-containing protein [Pustulibacterium marinum]SFU66205.1 protein of unknown function [Pustulibacterium marinum]